MIEDFRISDKKGAVKKEMNKFLSCFTACFLSESEIINSKYGFDKELWTQDIKRCCAPTTYAKYQGANNLYKSHQYVYFPGYNSEGLESCDWWLRTPYIEENNLGRQICKDLITHLGTCDFEYQTVGKGVRPAMWISLKS